MRRWLWGCAVVLGCSSGAPYQGRLVDGFTGAPISGVRVIAKSIGTTNDLTCAVREGSTADDGRFTLPELCEDLSYGVSLSDPSLQLSGQLAVRGGEGAQSVTDHTAWRAPKGPGLYLLEGDKLSRIRTWADVDTVKILGSDHAIRYPMMKPTPRTRLPTVGPDSKLVISTAGSIQNLEFHPLIPDTRRRVFEEKRITNHVYIGVKFTTDTQFTRLSATRDESKVTQVMSGKHAYHYLDNEAYPPGRYAVLSATDDVTYLVDFSR